MNGVLRTTFAALHPEAKDLFLTWRLYGSLPANRHISPERVTTGKAFVCVDRCLDRQIQGPRWLERPEIAALVVNALYYGERKFEHYRLHAFVVMCNHVHVLLSPLVAPPKLLHTLKGFTARQANTLLNRTGVPFWDREYYDHWIRDAPGFDRVRRYIENNPVKAGLVTSAEEYRWSSAGQAGRLAAVTAARNSSAAAWRSHVCH